MSEMVNQSSFGQPSLLQLHRELSRSKSDLNSAFVDKLGLALDCADAESVALSKRAGFMEPSLIEEGSDVRQRAVDLRPALAPSVPAPARPLHRRKRRNRDV